MRTLIANRGEIACRVIRACHSLGWTAIAVYSEADAQARHVAEADEAVAIGPAKPQLSYLNADALLDAAKASGAEAIHPGYGFLAENAAFARLVEAAGLVWIGPRPDTIAMMGDKDRARQIAVQAEVPVVPGSRRFEMGELDGLEDAAALVGYPLLVKAAGGGGGIGMRLVDAPAMLHEITNVTQVLAERAFADGTVFLERYIARARHVEVQVFGFGDGRAVHLFERECSIQRRFQKILEESPSPGISVALRSEITAAAVRLAEAVNYRGAGTVEFIVDNDSGAFYFLEMNTRIQVEHPVTEMVTGLDLVSLQLRLAAGENLADRLSADRIAQSGHAIEVRICAENPDRMFLPSPGTIKTLCFPRETPNVRIESGVRAGDRLSPFYDSMIAKIICSGDTRDEAIATMSAALGELELDGIVTNVAFLRQLLEHPAFRRGETLTGFVNSYLLDLTGPR